ncbi:hypothetical protein Tco_1037048 [Tanacetum coccineum]
MRRTAAAVAVFWCAGMGLCVHTMIMMESELLMSRLTSILSSEPTPLRKHTASTSTIHFVSMEESSILPIRCYSGTPSSAGSTQLAQTPRMSYPLSIGGVFREMVVSGGDVNGASNCINEEPEWMHLSVWIWVGHLDDGSKGGECAGWAMHLARRSPAEGGDSEDRL